MRSWVQVLQRPTTPASSGSGSAEAPVLVDDDAVVDSGRQPRVKKACPGITNFDQDLLSLFSRYGSHEDTQLTIRQTGGCFSIHAAACKNDAVPRRTTRRWETTACQPCWDFPQKQALKSRIARMKDVRAVLDLCKQSTFTAMDIETLTNFTRTTEANMSAGRQELVEQVKAIKTFNAWTAENGKKLSAMGYEPNSSPDSFLIKFSQIYRDSDVFRGGLLMSLVKAVIARAYGHTNAPVCGRLGSPLLRRRDGFWGS
eukprot:GHVU01189639.1.p1 GENE.GHVU01189639.1~~GHVU01189639.1.p1  ORF type:complete len:257 (+),score=38.17 GHVU01189639.1:585-1355(+)